MSKVFKIFILTFFLFSFFILLPKQTYAATIAPDPIGDLDLRVSKTVTVSGLQPNTKYYWQESKATYKFFLIDKWGYTNIFIECYTSDSSGSIQQDLGPFSNSGIYQLSVSRIRNQNSANCEPVGDVLSPKEFSVGGRTNNDCCGFDGPIYNRGRDKCEKIRIGIQALAPGQPNQCSKSQPKTFCEPESLKCFTTEILKLGSKICKNPKDLDFDNTKHAVCAKTEGIPCDQDPTNPGIATAIGCVHTFPIGFTQDILKFAVAISGGIAFLMMLMGAFQMLTSSGNPETLKGGQDRLISAIVGLLIVILAIILLRFIGVDILGILPL